ncbi:MAG: Na+/H+ antiporter NhaA [Rhodanobacter denitrificans]|uniref:Na(+)/H(+) antiporter NhaA n=1 Tax=Rhodanobacter denitrificans TaxID=666685 RepID=A0A2W5M2V3_9GAMM|nr:MAG: Na+/H+ antiporter NhaA [Rhodanobacter denitrificans]
MSDPIPSFAFPRTRRLAGRAALALERFLHVEAASGIVLLAAAALALLWANSPAADRYHALWHLPLTLGIGDWIHTQSLHFWINDGLMTVFFLVVGMEIRREMHDGALSNLRLAALPIAAALGGVVAPALIYVAFNAAAPTHAGWAIPTATDIAFAVGVLALLGRRVPANVRVFLLALAIIDDIVAVLIIALFYSGGLAPGGLAIALAGVGLVLALRALGAGSAWAYVLPGAVIWIGLLRLGVHPTLSGVVLGLLTPVLPPRRRRGSDAAAIDARHAEPEAPLDEAPVTRVQRALHPWVAYGVMPLFALANAGVSLGGVDLGAAAAQSVMLGVLLGLVVGKPIGIVAVSWVAVRLGGARLPPGVTWGGVWLIGLLAGIGFTMSIFVAMLAFDDAALLAAAKLGVLLASVIAACIGLCWGWLHLRGRSGDAHSDTA